ncbi:HPr kinase/phosphorylase [uncultured Sulfitobacter sp.]|uniref:HPr kinase/phosphorylase n=1 Tax=uncultured Sulfitobacter sp. TaxID=191468 RepID=UPI0026083155|nr:HPr kinase/phosphatase C-terminal domain-containing protein [uncultured Sulfitobacter sp.]
MSSPSATVHGGCVAIAGKAVLIIGPSGSGKSALALQLIAHGAELIADDRTILRKDGNSIIASVPETIAGMIEARGVGLITLPHLPDCKVVLVIDMGVVESARLPQRHTHSVLDIQLPCLHKVETPYFPAAILAYVRGTVAEVE